MGQTLPLVLQPLASSNVGIGKDPFYKLDINGDCNLSAGGVYRINGVPLATGGVPAGATGQVQFNNAGAFGASANLFWDNTNSRLGIGTTSPGDALTLVPVAYAPNQNGGIRLDNPSGTWTYRIALKSDSGGTVRLSFDTNSISNALTIASNGNVGIGTTSPWAPLAVNTANQSNPSLTYQSACAFSLDTNAMELAFGGSSVAPNPMWVQARLFNNNALPLALNPSGGNVGIGTPSPQVTLDCHGDAMLTRPSAPTTGALFFGGSTATYLFYDGTKFSLQGGSQLTIGGDCNVTGVYRVNGVPISAITTQNVVTASRTMNTVYQNTSGKPMCVVITAQNGGTTGVTLIYSDSSSAPTTVIAEIGNGPSQAAFTVTFWVLSGNYYKATAPGSPMGLLYWVEYT